MKKDEIKVEENQKIGIGTTIVGIWALVCWAYGMYMSFMAIAVGVMTMTGAMEGKFRHNLAYMLDLIDWFDKEKLKEDEA